MVSKVREAEPPPTTIIACVRGRTMAVKVRVELAGGDPLSVTRTVIWLVLGDWACVGVHENNPLPAPMLAPPPTGWLSRLKLSVCGGVSGSLADTWKVMVC